MTNEKPIKIKFINSENFKLYEWQNAPTNKYQETWLQLVYKWFNEDFYERHYKDGIDWKTQAIKYLEGARQDKDYYGYAFVDTIGIPSDMVIIATKYINKETITNYDSQLVRHYIDRSRRK